MRFRSWRDASRWTTEDRGRVLEQLQPAVEGTAGDHLESDVGKPVVLKVIADLGDDYVDALGPTLLKQVLEDHHLEVGRRLCESWKLPITVMHAMITMAGIVTAATRPKPAARSAALPLASDRVLSAGNSARNGKNAAIATPKRTNRTWTATPGDTAVRDPAGIGRP